MRKQVLGVGLVVLALATLSVGAVTSAAYGDATCYTGCTTQTTGSTSPVATVVAPVQPKTATNSGGLVLTGADIEGMAIIGAGACLVGALMLRRNRRRDRTPIGRPSTFNR